MQKRMQYLLLVLALGATAASAQTTLRLRTGGPQSAYRILDASGNPATVSVENIATGKRVHDFADGEVIHIQFAPGCVELNGYRRVVSPSASAGTMQLTDLQGQPVGCAERFEPAFGSGMLGRVRDYTLQPSHPHFLVPPGGPIGDRMRDPDGTKGNVALVARENGPAWQGLVRYTAGLLDDTKGCDGVTPSKCPKVASNLKTGGLWASTFPLAMALVWYADNSKTSHLQTVRYLINNWEQVSLQAANGTTIPSFFCDVDARYCGHSSGVDWLSEYFIWIAAAYDLVYDQLTPDERRTFARKIMNGWTGDSSGCAQPVTRLAQPVSIAAGQKTLTGSGLSMLKPGDYVYVHNPSGRSSGSGFVVSAAGSDTQVTTSAAPTFAMTNAPAYLVRPGWQEGQCGAMFDASGHLARLQVASKRWLYKLAAGVDAGSTSITLNHTAGLPAPPFELMVDTEILKVTAVSGRTLTVERSTHPAPYSAAAHGANASVVWSAHTANLADTVTRTGPSAIIGSWTDNVSYQKLHGFLALSMVLADVDDDARQLAEESWNFYYNLTYPYLSDYWTGMGQGGVENGYSLGRWLVNHIWAGTLAQNAFTEPNPIFGNYSYRALLSTLYSTRPGSWKNQLTAGDGALLNGNALAWAPVFMYFAGPSNPDRAYMNFWYQNLAEMNTVGSYASSNGVKGAIMASIYLTPDIPTADFRSTLKPWRAFRETDWDILPGSGKGIWISRSDWSDNASALYANLQYFDVSDGHDQDYFYTPGHYMVVKGGEYLLGTDSSQGFWAGSSAGTNYMELGGSATMRRSMVPQWPSLGESCDNGQRNRMDLAGGGTGYTQARGNFGESFCSTVRVNKAQRHFVHLTGREYVIIWDNYATAVNKQHRSRLTYFRADEPTNTPIRTGDRVVFNKSNGKVETQWFFPDGKAPTITESGTTNSFRYSMDWGNTTSAKMLTVHRIGASSNDSLPPTKLLSAVDPNTIAVQMNDGSNSRVVAFSADGSLREAVDLASDFSGVGQYVLTGLKSGGYRVYKSDGTSLTTGEIVVRDKDGSLSFQGAPGAYAIRRTSAAAAAINVSPSSVGFEYRAGDPDPGEILVHVTCDADCMVAAAASCSWAAASVRPNSSREIDVAVTANPSGLELGDHQCDIRLSAPDFGDWGETVSATLKIIEPVPLRIDTAELMEATVGVEYRQDLVASGGKAPYRWSLLGMPLPAGLELSAEGVVRGTPEMDGCVDLEFEVGDDSSPPMTVTASLKLCVAPAPPVEPEGFTDCPLELGGAAAVPSEK